MTKCASLEKTKSRQAAEIEDMCIELERSTRAAQQLDKKQRDFDKTLAEARQKEEEMHTEYEMMQKESRVIANELFKTRHGFEECADGLESARRENINLKDEISELTDHLNAKARLANELERALKLANEERNELKCSLEEGEAAIDAEEAKVVRYQINASQARQDAAKKLAEKDEELDNTRRSGLRAVEAIQGSLDTEMRARSEALRAKKKFEADLNDLEIHLALTNKHCSDAQQAMRVLSAENKDNLATIEDTRRINEELSEQLAIAERRATSLQADMEELSRTFDHTEATRKLAEKTLKTKNADLAALELQHSALIVSKRKLEAEYVIAEDLIGSSTSEQKNAESKAKKAIHDVTLMADELRKEQDQSIHLGKMRKNLELTIKVCSFRTRTISTACLVHFTIGH